MPTPIDLALSSLLPTLSYLPPELTSLSTSLLAQSRAKASSLKPEEEIGRTYACCHIASQRLGHKLALEIAKPSPPVKPKVYAKLHRYLNAVLKTTAAPSPRTPGGKVTRERESGGRGNKSAEDTPSKSRTTTPTIPKKRPAPDETLETFAPLIHHISTTTHATDAHPHVFAGLSSILTRLQSPSGSGRLKTTRGLSLTPSQVPPLIIALFVCVHARLRGCEAHTESEDEMQEAAVRALRQWERDERWRDEDVREEVSRWKKAIRSDWGEMEWYSNVPVGAEGEEDGRPAKTPLRRKEKRANRPSDEDHVGAAGLLPGLGTMFQPALDWLSEERVADFAAWKREVLGMTGAAA